MSEIISTPLARRNVLAGIAGAGLLALPGCTSLGALGGGFGLTDAIRRILLLSSDRAFARLTAPGGFWDDQVGRIGLSNVLGARGDIVSGILTSALFKSRLEGALADVAVEGATRAAPLVADAVRVVGVQNAVALVRGGPTAATSFLQNEMGGQLVEAMVPELGEALRLSQDPIIGQALAALTGVDIGGIANSFSGRINDTIWSEIGREETAIRANPGATNDPLIIGVFGAGAAL